MQTFSGFHYLLIDVSNNMGLDKLTFDKRIQWTLDHLESLESLVDDADSKPAYMKSVQALRKAQKGIPTGHLVELDACCSGLQMLSVLTGCTSGANATGLVDPAVRADAYSSVTALMNEHLKDQGISIDIPRAQAKEAVMTVFYGSKNKPIEIFGEDTPELDAFYQAVNDISPGSWDALQELLGAWQPYALSHQWKLPDGFDSKVKVMVPAVDKKGNPLRISIDELDGASFTYEYYINQGTKKGISLPANVTHSIDAYVLRSMHRRCNYDLPMVLVAQEAILSELDLRIQGITDQVAGCTGKLAYYIQQYERSGMADVVILPWVTDGYATMYMGTDHLEALAAIVEGMLAYTPFELVTIHDAFRSHANNCNHVRYQYKEILAELAESNLLSDLLSQITGTQGSYTKLSNNLGELIRKSNYALS